MYVCMYVRIYLGMYVHTHTHTIQACIHKYIHTYIRICMYVCMYVHIIMCDLYVFGKGHWRPDSLHPLLLVGGSLQSYNHLSLCGGRADPWDCLDTCVHYHWSCWLDCRYSSQLTAARAMWNHCSMNSVSRQWILLIVWFVYIGGVGAALSDQVQPDSFLICSILGPGTSPLGVYKLSFVFWHPCICSRGFCL